MTERGKDGDDGWARVSHKRRPRDKQSSCPTDPITKYFVANIPSGCRPWDLADVLKSFGEICRIYIAKKTNKEGVRFGFASFIGVKDPSGLEKLMQNVKIGMHTLKINVAWFARENVESVRPRFKDDNGSSKGFFRSRDVRVPGKSAAIPRVPDLKVDKGFSYKDAVKGFDKGFDGGGFKQVEVVLDDSYEGSTALFNRSVVVRCVNFDTLNSLFSILC